MKLQPFLDFTEEYIIEDATPCLRTETSKRFENRAHGTAVSGSLFEHARS